MKWNEKMKWWNDENEKRWKDVEIEVSAQKYPPENFCKKIGEGVVYLQWYMPGRFVVVLHIGGSRGGPTGPCPQRILKYL